MYTGLNRKPFSPGVPVGFRSQYGVPLFVQRVQRVKERTDRLSEWYDAMRAIRDATESVNRCLANLDRFEITIRANMPKGENDAAT